jgi:hypothetical protein
MRRLVRLAGLLVILACQEKDIVVTEVNPVQTGQFEAILAGLPAWPTAGGTVSVSSYTSYLIADASVTGLAAATAYQWKAYFGTCAAKLLPLGPAANPSAFPTITTDANGAATSRATLASRFKADSTYNIRFYTTPNVAPASPDTTWYACGDIQRK